MLHLSLQPLLALEFVDLSHYVTRESVVVSSEDLLRHVRGAVGRLEHVLVELHLLQCLRLTLGLLDRL